MNTKPQSSFLERFRNGVFSSFLAVALRVPSIRAFYEGAQRWNPSRSYIPGVLRDARFDVDQSTRIELQRKSRYFERNNAIANRLADLFEQFTTGAEGLRFSPASSSQEWNLLAAKHWADWCRYADLTSRQSFGTLQSLISRLWFVDGECFILLTAGERGKDGKQWPRLQVVEAHRVKTYPNATIAENHKVIDGIEVNEYGRPVAYWVQDVVGDISQASTSVRYPAESVIHVFEPSRPGQYRGIPFLAPVMNDLHDLDDLQMLEMQAAKEAAETTNVIYNAAGEADDEESMLNRYVAIPDNQRFDNTENRLEYYKQSFGAKAKYLRPGDKMEQFKSDRPSVATSGYWEYLTSKVCIGVGIPLLLVMPPRQNQGTSIRSELEVANAFFRSRSSVLSSCFREVYAYVMDWHRRQVLELSDPPADWRNVTTCAPRSVNVDVGRNSSAMLAELAAGVTTMEDIYAPQGKDWRERIRQKATERAFIKEVALEMGLTPEEVAAAAVDAASAAVVDPRVEKPEPQEIET